MLTLNINGELVKLNERVTELAIEKKIDQRSLNGARSEHQCLLVQHTHT